MGAKVAIALVGTAGYGSAYLDALLAALPQRGDVKFVGAVDAFPERCTKIPELKANQIPLVPSLEKLFRLGPVDLLMISTPIHLHAAQTCFGLEHGADVLCEKPLCGSLDDAMQMRRASQKSGHFAAIGFQWSFSSAVQALKRDILGGVLGRPIRMKTLACAPRALVYFGRNDWAGKIRASGGAPVLDSPVSNATSHFLHNMFYLLGATQYGSAMPAMVQAELYRANRIENYDTAAIRCVTDSGVEILFFTTHAVQQRGGPVAVYEFERATVEFDASDGARFVARFRDGRVKDYGSPNVDRHEKIWQCVESVRTRRPTACEIDAAIPHTMCVVAAQESSHIREFPAALRRTEMLDGNPMICVDGLDGEMTRCFSRGMLPSELGDVNWAEPGERVDLTGQRWMQGDEGTNARSIVGTATALR